MEQQESGRPGPPLAERAATRETLHGRIVEDPYRWLEDEQSPEVQTFMSDHDRYARARLAEYPSRDGFRARVKELTYVDTRSPPIRRGRRSFWSEKPKTRDKALYVYQDDNEAKRTLLDPLALEPDGSLAIGAFVPSPDGELVAYLENPDNADESTLHILEVDSGETRPAESIPGLRYTTPVWRPDGSGFFYTWMPRGESLSSNDRIGLAEIRFHRIGTDPESDVTLRANTGDPTRFLSARVSDDGRWLLVTMSRGWSETEIFVRDLRSPKADWQELTEGKPPAIYDAVAHQDRIWVRTNLDASRYQVYSASAQGDAFGSWELLIPEDPEVVVENIQVFGGHLVVHGMRRALSEVTMYSLDGKRAGAVELPGPGTLTRWEGRADQSDFFFVFEGFDRPQEIWRVQAASGDTELISRTKAEITPGRLELRELSYASRDGTQVSMFVLESSEARGHGPRPTLLYGYGGFNISMTPTFSPAVVAWVERGGVYALAHLRGGGEYGEAWHAAGMLKHKQNVFDDFIAAAEYLIEDGWTSPAQLGISGRSNGGLLVGAAMTQRPDLFRAVVCGVPLLDMVRYHRFGIGQAWVPEYGSPEQADQFEWLYAYSPYHSVRPNQAYPALLMLSADHDDRVDPLHARKFVAQVRWARSDRRPTLLRIEAQSGHGGSDLRSQWIERAADELSFLWGELNTAEMLSGTL